MKKGFKIGLLSIAMLFGGCSVTSACVSVSKQETAIVCRAEEESLPPEDTDTITEEDVDEAVEDLLADTKDWVQEKWDTFVAPMLGGISISAILTFVCTFIFNYLKEKKVTAKLAEVGTQLVACQAIIETVTKIYEELATNKQISQETQELLNSTCRDLQDKIKLTSEQLMKIDRFEKVIKLLVQLETKLAMNSDCVVRAGIIEDIKEIKELLKQL